MGEELMTQKTDTQPEVDPTSPHYQNDPSFIDENQTPEAQEKAILEWQKAAYPGYVKLRSCEEIYDTIYHKRDPIVEGLIDHGTIILGGASKVGKLPRSQENNSSAMFEDFFNNWYRATAS